MDLFVRASNKVASNMYGKLGYTVYRRVLDYYSGEEDALGILSFLSLIISSHSLTPFPSKL